MKALDTTCAYHPGNTAIAICQHCRNSICKLDLNRFKYIRGPEAFDLCFFCFKKKEQSERAQSLIVSIMFLIFFIFIPVFYIVYAHAPSSFSSFLIFPEIIFGSGCIFFSIYYQSINGKINEATERYSTEPANTSAYDIQTKDTGMKNLGTQNFFSQTPTTTTTTPLSSNNKSLVTQTDTTTTTTCTFCGTKLSPDDVFCPNCGNRRD